MENLEVRPLKNVDTQRAPTSQKTSIATRTCLLILGMHRSGTSALTRTLNLLGYSLPEKLIGALEGNEVGHWEPENIVLFNDRLLSDMGSAWHDFRSLPPSRLGPEALHKAELQLRDLLQREFGDASHIILKDPRICRLTPLYIQALEHLQCRTVPHSAADRVSQPSRSHALVAASA